MPGKECHKEVMTPKFELASLETFRFDITDRKLYPQSKIISGILGKYGRAFPKVWSIETSAKN